MLEKIKEIYNDYKYILYNVIKYLKIGGVLLFIIFEEIAWNRIGRPAYIKVKSLKIMTRFEYWVTDFENRYVLLLIFIVPFIMMEIMSVLALKALASGAIVICLGLYAIKIFLTVPVVIIFNVSKQQLVSFYPIRYIFGAILNFKRSYTFRTVKKYIKILKTEFEKFKNDYLDGDETNLVDEIKKIYNDIKKM